MGPLGQHYTLYLEFQYPKDTTEPFRTTNIHA